MHSISVDSKISVRLIDRSDAVEFYNLIDSNRAHLKTWLTWTGLMSSTSVAERYIESRIKLAADKGGFCFTILYEGKIVGIVHLVDIDSTNKKGMIGYWIAEKYTRLGIVTKSVNAVIELAFNEMKLHRIEIRCATGNIASSAIPKKLGFKHEGVIRDGEWLHERFVDQDLYSLLSTERSSISY